MSDETSRRESSTFRSDYLFIGLLFLTGCTIAVATGILLLGIVEPTVLDGRRGISSFARASTLLMLRADAAVAFLLAIALLLKARAFHGRGWLVAMLGGTGVVLLLLTYGGGPLRPSGDLPPGITHLLLAIGVSAAAVIGMSGAAFAGSFPQRVPSERLKGLLIAEHAVRWPKIRMGPRQAALVTAAVSHAPHGVPMVAVSLLLSVLLLRPPIWVALLLTLTYVVPALWAVQILLARYRDPDAPLPEKRSVLWVVMGLAIGLWLWYPIAGVTQVLLPEDMKGAWLMAVLAGGQGVMLTCLYVAAFWAGTFDPALAIRRSTAYGTLSMVVVFVVALIEEVASDLLVTRLGIPNGWTVWITGGLVAVLVALLHKRYATQLGRFMDWVTAHRMELGVSDQGSVDGAQSEAVRDGP